jgi:hypothetical protein
VRLEKTRVYAEPVVLCYNRTIPAVVNAYTVAHARIVF